MLILEQENRNYDSQIRKLSHDLYAKDGQIEKLKQESAKSARREQQVKSVRSLKSRALSDHSREQTSREIQLKQEQPLHRQTRTPINLSNDESTFRISTDVGKKDQTEKQSPLRSSKRHLIQSPSSNNGSSCMDISVFSDKHRKKLIPRKLSSDGGKKRQLKVYSVASPKPFQSRGMNIKMETSVTKKHQHKFDQENPMSF